jgi:hypothetical protein
VIFQAGISHNAIAENEKRIDRIETLMQTLIREKNGVSPNQP